MTYEEVKKIREQHYVDSEDDFFEASRMVGIAIDKQILQKPHKVTNSNDEFIKYECPECGGYLIKNYPCKCGQMVDWSEE